MGLEAATYIHQLNPSNPVGAVDPKAQGDDHLRMIKSTLQATLPNIAGAMTKSHTQLNAMAADTGFAAPTVDVGIGAPSAGVATTILRSDALLRLSLSITPTWTGVHTFGNASGVFNTNANPSYYWNDTDSGVDAKIWRFNAVADSLVLSTRTDVNGGGQNAIVIDRTGTIVTGFDFGNVVGNPTYDFLGTGAATFGGNVLAGPIVSATDGAVLTKIQSLAGTPAGMVGTQSNHQFDIRSNNTIRMTFLAAGGVTLAAGNIFVVPAGTAGAPTIVFSGDGDSGRYWIGANNLGEAIGGVNVAEWNSAANGSLKIADFGGTLQDVGFRNIPQNSQSANYGLVLADSGKHIYHPSGGGAGDTFTIPANGSVAYPIGTALTFVNGDSNSVSIAITTDTMTLAGTTTTGTRTLAQNGIATAIKVTATSWIISGTGLS